jgi:hypothetical protein
MYAKKNFSKSFRNRTKLLGCVAGTGGRVSVKLERNPSSGLWEIATRNFATSFSDVIFAKNRASPRFSARNFVNIRPNWTRLVQIDRKLTGELKSDRQIAIARAVPEIRTLKVKTFFFLAKFSKLNITRTVRATGSRFIAFCSSRRALQSDI